MSLNVAAVQAALRADGLDAWLLYDFRGLNPIAGEVTGVGRQGGHLATRRWYYLIPAEGDPRGLVHAIERDALAHLPGTTQRYAGRDQLVAGLRLLVQRAARAGEELRGWQVDRAASAVLREAGYGDHILHRTGHSLGETVHGNGVNMDDYETHDDRRLLAGTGFTIEPGVYFDDFGVRTEINMVVQARGAAVTGPLQAEILALG
jgi:hypothetical protein